MSHVGDGTQGGQGHDDSILIDDNDDGNSASEWGRNDTDVFDSKKDLSFIIVREEARGVVISYCNSLTNNKVRHTELSGTAHTFVRYGTHSCQVRHTQLSRT